MSTAFPSIAKMAHRIPESRNGHMSTRVMTIHPAQAEEWLRTTNIHNRRITKNYVQKLARDMTTGRYCLSHQSIAFTPVGVLLDGQHRLAAIVLAGIPVQVNVSFNVPANSQLIVDQHKNRSAADSMTLMGGIGIVNKDDVAILRRMLIGFHGTKMSLPEEYRNLQKHWGAIQFAKKAIPTRNRGIGNASTRAAVARAWYCIDHSELEQFCRVLVEGMATDPAEVPILMLWKYLVQTPRNDRRSRLDKYAKTERAIQAYVTGEHLKKLYAPSYEMFQLPEETDSDGDEGQVVIKDGMVKQLEAVAD